MNSHFAPLLKEIKPEKSKNKKKSELKLAGYTTKNSHVLFNSNLTPINENIPFYISGNMLYIIQHQNGRDKQQRICFYEDAIKTMAFSLQHEMTVTELHSHIFTGTITPVPAGFSIMREGNNKFVTLEGRKTPIKLMPEKILKKIMKSATSKKERKNFIPLTQKDYKLHQIPDDVIEAKNYHALERVNKKLNFIKTYPKTVAIQKDTGQVVGEILTFTKLMNRKRQHTHTRIKKKLKTNFFHPTAFYFVTADEAGERKAAEIISSFNIFTDKNHRQPENFYELSAWMASSATHTQETAVIPEEPLTLDALVCEGQDFEALDALAATYTQETAVIPEEPLIL